jgi:hypothetical protein
MSRLWNLLIYGEWQASQWESIREVATYLDGDTTRAPVEFFEIQRNQYGRVRRVRIY